jgi:protein TonB
MEMKKTPQADLERQRTTGFLLGLVLVLACCYVALEWNFQPAEDVVDAMDLSQLMHETELVPMTNEETAPLAEKAEAPETSEQLRVVDEAEAVEEETPLNTPAEDEVPAKEPVDDKPLAALDVNPDNPLNFHVAEDLPQFPGGAVEFMKWLTQHLRYPSKAQKARLQGQVMAVFYVETDGSITGVKVTRSLSEECDREVLRVLGMMPHWQPGIRHDRPCRTKVQIPVVFKL